MRVVGTAGDEAAKPPLSDTKRIVAEVCRAAEGAKGVPHAQLLQLFDGDYDGLVYEADFKAWLDLIGASLVTGDLELLIRHFRGSVAATVRYQDFLQVLGHDFATMRVLFEEICSLGIESLASDALPQDRNGQLEVNKLCTWLLFKQGLKKVTVAQRRQLALRFGAPDIKSLIIIPEFVHCLNEYAARDRTGRAAYLHKCRSLRVGYSNAVLNSLQRTQLSLEHSHLDILGSSALASALAVNECIEELRLAGNSLFGDRGVVSIVDSLSATVTSVDFSNCGLGPEGATAIGRALRRFQLVHVSLCRNRVRTEGAVAIADALGASRLRTLRMSHSHIGELGGLALGVALGACHTLECLDLSFNVIQSGGEAILWNATSLKYLDLSFGSLNDSAADALAHLVCFGHQLEHLNCASNRLGEASGLLVAAALRVGCRCASLASLHLGFQRLGERASLELVRAIAKRTSITTLGVENTTIAGGEQPVIDAAEHATQQRGKPAQVAAEHPQRYRATIPDEVIAVVYPSRSVPGDSTRDKKMIRMRAVPATMVERVESSSGRTLESRKWTLRNSVWKLRPKEADCKAFYDTRAFLDTTAASDLDRSKVLQLLRGNRDEYARVTAVMQRFFGELQLIHRYFSALGEGWPFSIQWNEWRDFVTVCGVTYGQQCNLEELDIVFIAANIPPAGVKETADKVLTRCEFLEAVVRAAIKRYDLLTPAEAVQRLLEREVIPKAREQRVLELGDEYRRKRLYKPGVGILLEKYAKLIDALWTKSRRRLSVISTTSTEIGGGTATRRKHSFTEQGNQFQALAYDDRLLNIDTWLRMVEQTVYEVTTFTQLSARIAYVMSKPTVQQSERRTQAATSATDEHVYLTRTDFNEVLCRSADALIPSSWSVPLDKKLPHLLALFAKHHDITKLFIALGGERDVAIDPWGTTTQVTEEDSASYLDDIQLLRARDLEIRREKALADAEARLCAELRRSTLSMTFQTPSPRPASKERRREQRRKLLSTIKTHVSGWRAACAVFSVSSSSTSPGLHLLLEVRVFLFEPRRTLVMLVESRDLEIVATKIGSIDEVNLAEALVKRLRVQTGVLPRDLSLSVDDSDVMPYTSSMSVCDVQYLRPAEKSSGVTPDAQARDVPDKDTRTDDAVERQRHPGTSHDIIPYEGDQFWHRARLEFARGRIQDLLAKVCEDEGSKISHFDLLAMDYIDLPLSPTNDTLTALSLFERGTPVVAA